jgi:hypothetical protein
VIPPPTSRSARLAAGVTLIATFLVAGAPPTRAEGATPYLRLHVGGGYAYVHGSGSNGIADNNLYGAGVSLGGAFGATLPSGISVFGTGFGIFMPGAKYEEVPSGPVPPFPAGNHPYTITMGALGGLGAGAAYAFVPSHVTISGALAAMEAATYDAGTESTYGHFFTHVGVGLHLVVGKEWVRPTSSWRLGVAGELAGARMTSTDEVWWGGEVGILFTASTD